MRERSQEIGLFRYRLAREAADPSLSARERGRLVRELAAREHLGPDGRWITVSRNTLDRWIRAYRRAGFAALCPEPRRAPARTASHLLALACALRAESPGRTAAQIERIITEAEGRSPSARTIQRHLVAAGLHRQGQPARATGRFEAERPNELWTGDALHGPLIASQRAILFCFIDDHSRLFCGYRWTLREDVLEASRALRGALCARGVPGALYLDNGSPFVSHQLLRACAVLGIRLIHSRPGRPEGRGKIERAFRTVREQFLVELEHRPVADIGELQRLFQAWVESVYHRRAHSETGQAPLDRFLAAGAPALASEAKLSEAFLWSERRMVSKTGTISLHGNSYEVSPELAGQRVELVFDPLDMSAIEVRLGGRVIAKAIPLEVRRHVHPHAQSEPGREAGPQAGIDYLGLVQDRRARELEARIDYRKLPAGDDGHGNDEGKESRQ